jgi:hypothetical protein
MQRGSVVQLAQSARRDCDGVVPQRQHCADESKLERHIDERGCSNSLGTMIGAAGASSIVEAIKSSTSLVELDLRSCGIDIDDPSSSRLFFSSMPLNLRHLHVGGANSFSAVPQDFFRLR